MKIVFNENVANKQKQIEDAKKEIENLTKKLSELNTNVITLSQEAQQEEMKIRTTESNFKASADIIINTMLTDKEKINSFLV